MFLRNKHSKAATNEAQEADEVMNDDTVAEENEQNQQPEDIEETVQDTDEEDDEDFPIRFRNYTPREQHLKKFVALPIVTVTTMDDEGQEHSKRTFKTLEDETADLIKEHIGPIMESAKPKKDDNPLSLVPGKLNWDLKRDVMPKLQLLEKKTMEALAEMLQNKMEAEEEYD